MSAAKTARTLLVVLLLMACGTLPALARADGDPASDVLIADDVFYPYAPSVSAGLAERLAGETAAARSAGFTVKVALIESPNDLGAAAILFGKPQTYANFLEQEISELAPHRLLLVVMPAGYGVSSASQPAQRAAAALSKPAGNTSDDLARAAIIAIPKLAAATGHPLQNIHDQPAANTSATSWKLPTLAILALGAVVIASAIVVVRQRRARRR